MYTKEEMKEFFDSIRKQAKDSKIEFVIPRQHPPAGRPWEGPRSDFVIIDHFSELRADPQKKS